MSKTDIDYKDLMQKAFLKVENLKSELTALKSQKTEPIAIIGLGCRFPGGSNDPEAFWQMLIDGRDGRTEVPKDRWDIDSYYDPDLDAPGKMYTRYANFLKQVRVDEFDPLFFGISPREAMWMDPQQRLLLEVVWESLEYAALSPTELMGSQTGIFVGMMTHDYYQLVSNSGKVEPFLGTDNATTAGRIAYFLGVHGPTLTLETTCSSSLVACHLASQSLRNQECNLAVVAGVNLMLTPEVTLWECRVKALSPDGRSKTFDAAADGYARGEGCGSVILKRLSDAVAGGDRILAVIRGSAVNHDGPSSGLTVPYGLAQAKVIHQAVNNSQVEPGLVDYLECHGTGTSLGDPIEVEALASIYGQDRPQERPLLIGSVKTNIGHLEGAAGLAGLIKVVLSLQNEKLPPHLHFKQPNPQIPWAELPVEVPTELRPWLKGEKTRLAGVSSFGMSGTNAHVILSEAPSQVKSQKPKIKSEDSPERPVQILTLSAQTETALYELVSRYHNYLEIHPELELGDVCYTANIGRAHFNYRLTAIAATKDELVEKLLHYKTGKEVVGLFSGEIEGDRSSPPKVAFLFTGQGSQYVKMGWQLYQSQPIFRQALDKCDEILSSELEHSLISVIYPQTDDSDSSILDQTAYTQPAIFAIEYALAQLWQSWGIKPNVVMGHSVGEYVAATIAGVFSLEDGLKLIAARGRLMQKLPSGGKMVSVMASESKVRSLITPYKEIAVAAINGPESTVISGDEKAIDTIINKLESEGIKTKQLQVSHAFHSPLMEPMLAEFETIANQVTYNQPRIPLISNLTGSRADKNIATASYWVNHVRQPVKFAQSIESLHQQNYRIFIEIGSKPILLAMGRQCLSEEVGVWLPSLRPGVEEWEQMLSSLGNLYVEGVKIDWSGFDQEYERQKVVLPTYPFQRQSYWLETAENGTRNIREENGKNSIVNLVASKETEALAQKLAKAGNLSEKEIELLPKLLELLVKELQQQQTVTGIKNLLYEIEWRTQARFGRVLPTDKLLKPTEIEQQLNTVLTELVNQGNLDGYKEIIAQLEELSVGYVVKAFREMGWQYKPGDSFTKDSLAKELKVIPSQRPLLNRMLQILGEVKILEETQDQWQVLETLEEVKPESQSQILLDKYPSAIIEFTLLNRCASQLTGVLRGAIDAVQLVFPEGDLTSATRLYKESQGAIVINTVIDKAIAKATEKLPHSRGIRLLEVGGGTGGTTSHILPNLNPNQSEYVFTDIGALFVSKAKEKFQDYPFVRYQTLNIELDPTTQGFEPHQYDVIIASNVLHATSNMTQTMTNVRKLLAPGGLLVVWEGTVRQRWVDLFAGGLEGWWKFDDLDLRPDHPLLSRTKWKKLLSETGFSQVITLPENEEILEMLSYQAVIIAQADETQLEETLDTGKTWLILADKQGVAQNLATKLHSLGEVCTLVFAGEKYQQISPEEFTINPQNPKEFEQLIGQIPNLYGVVQCWSLEAGISKKLNTQELADLSELGCGTTLSVVQALIKKQLSQTVRLWLVTQGAQPVPQKNPVVPGIAQSSLWGMGKVIANEHPELNCVRIDLGPEQTIEQKGLVLWSEIWSQDKEDQVVLRDETRYVPRLVRSAPTQLEAPLNFREDSTYLIAGGLGGVGLLVASWMVKQGAKNLVLVGRSSPSDVAQKKLTELEQMGAKVVIAEADISEVTSIAKVLSDIEESLPPLRGIINSAVVVDDALIEQYTWEKFSKALAPKIKGSWNLHNLTKDMPIDFFILFSSAASIFGNPGLGSYTAANAFQDTMAHYRRMIGLPAQTIHWPAVTETGLEVKFQTTEQAKEKGLGVDAISPEKVLEVLEVLMTSDGVEVGVLNIDWSQGLVQYLESRLFDDWRDATQVSSESEAELLQQLKAAIASERRELLLTYVRSEVARVLGIKLSQEVDWKQGFFGLGMDSLMAVELRGRLQKSLGCNLSSTLTFTYSTIDTLVDYLVEVVEEMLGVDDEFTITDEISETDIESDIDDLSDEEAETSLLDKLDNLGY